MLAAKLSNTCFLQLDFSLVLLLFNTHRIPFKKSSVSNAFARYPENLCLTVVLKPEVLNATTGHEHALASEATCPNDSTLEGINTKSAAE